MKPAGRVPQPRRVGAPFCDTAGQALERAGQKFSTLVIGVTDWLPRAVNYAYARGITSWDKASRWTSDF